MRTILFLLILILCCYKAEAQEQKISHDSIPAEIEKKLHNKYKKHKVLQAFKIQSNDVVKYKIETLRAVSEAKEINLTLFFDENGKIIDKDKKVTHYFGLDSQKKPVQTDHGHSH